MSDDEQATVGADPRSGVGERIRDAELLAQVRDERPESPQLDLVLLPVLAQVAGLDQFTPRDHARSRRFRSQDRVVPSSAPFASLDPPVECRARHPQYASRERLVV